MLTPPLTDDPRVLAFLEAREIRYVRIAPVIDSGRSLAVDIDDRAAARAVAEHLVALGHCRFGLVTGPMQHGRAAERGQGFLDRIRELLPEAMIFEDQGSFDFASGLAAGRRLVALPDGPTAIFAANDDMAAGVVNAALQLRRSVPGELSICGFDDSWIARSVSPELTTIHQPIAEMAGAAVDLLLGLRPERHARLDYALVLRASTAPPPGQDQLAAG